MLRGHFVADSDQEVGQHSLANDDTTGKKKEEQYAQECVINSSIIFSLLRVGLTYFFSKVLYICCAWSFGSRAFFRPVATHVLPPDRTVPMVHYEQESRALCIAPGPTNCQLGHT